MAKQKKRWFATRDNDNAGKYNLHHQTRKPVMLKSGGFKALGSMDTKRWIETFGLRLKKGECVEIERIAAVRK